MTRLPAPRARLAPLLYALMACLALGAPATAGAVTQAFDPSRPWDRSAVGADALESTPAGKRSPAQRAAAEGFERLLAGRLAEAEAAFGKALAADAKYLPALLGLADVRLRQRRPADAQAYIERAMALDPASADVYTATRRRRRPTSRRCNSIRRPFSRTSTLPTSMRAHYVTRAPPSRSIARRSRSGPGIRPRASAWRWHCCPAASRRPP